MVLKLQDEDISDKFLPTSGYAQLLHGQHGSDLVDSSSMIVPGMRNATEDFLCEVNLSPAGDSLLLPAASRGVHFLEDKYGSDKY